MIILIAFLSYAKYSAVLKQQRESKQASNMDLSTTFYSKPSNMSPYSIYDKTIQKGGYQGYYSGYYSRGRESKMNSAAASMLAGLLGLGAGVMAYKKVTK